MPSESDYLRNLKLEMIEPAASCIYAMGDGLELPRELVLFSQLGTSLLLGIQRHHAVGLANEEDPTERQIHQEEYHRVHTALLAQMQQEEAIRRRFRELVEPLLPYLLPVLRRGAEALKRLEIAEDDLQIADLPEEVLEACKLSEAIDRLLQWENLDVFGSYCANIWFELNRLQVELRGALILLEESREKESERDGYPQGASG